MKHKLSFYIYLAFIAIFLVLSFLVVEPYITAVLLGAIFAYWMYPLHVRLRKKVRETPSALILSGALLTVLLLIAQYLFYILVREILKLSNSIGSTAQAEIFAKEIISGVTLRSVFDGIIGKVTSAVSSLIYSSPDLLVAFMIFIVSFYYFLRDGEKIVDWIGKNVPFPSSRRKNLISQGTGYIEALLKAQLLIGLIQGVVCAFGFFLFGLNDYIVVGGIFAAILSILPVIGPYILYLPVSGLLIASGQVFNGVGLLLFGIIIGSVLDYVIRPIITAKYAKMHSLVILVGAIGGMYIFGLIGFFIGPIILGISITVLETIGEGKFLPEESEE